MKILENFFKVFNFSNTKKIKVKLKEISNINEIIKIDKKKYNFIIYKNSKISFFMLIYIIFKISSFKEIKNNFFIIFNDKNYWTGNNLIPDWPGNLTEQFFIKNFYEWVKKAFYIFYYKKRIKFLIFESNDFIN